METKNWWFFFVWFVFVLFNSNFFSLVHWGNGVFSLFLSLPVMVYSKIKPVNYKSIEKCLCLCSKVCSNSIFFQWLLNHLKRTWELPNKRVSPTAKANIKAWKAWNAPENRIILASHMRIASNLQRTQSVLFFFYHVFSLSLSRTLLFRVCFTTTIFENVQWMDETKLSL